MKPLSSRLRAVALAAVALGIAVAAPGCRSIERLTLRNYAVQVATPVVWSGSRVVLTAAGLVGADTQPIVVIGTDTVAVRYAAPDSLIAAAPSSPGLFAVLVGFGGLAPVTVGTVRLAGGYAGTWNAGSLAGRPQAWPGAPLTSFAALTDSGLALVDARLRTVRRVLSDPTFDVTCMNGVGPAAGGRIAASGCGGPLFVAGLDPFTVGPDTGPGASGRFAAQLAPGRWLVAYHHGVTSYLRNASGGWDASTVNYHVEEPYDVAVSPRGDRAVVLGRDQIGTGMPVFSAASPDPVYFLTGFNQLWGAVFSEDGDTLFVAGPPAAGAHAVLAALRASDGAVLKSAPAWDGVQQIVLDPAGTWMYLVGHASLISGPGIQVVDRATFAPVTLLAGPPESVGAGDANAIFSAAERRLYIVDACSFCGVGTVPIIAFDLIP